MNRTESDPFVLGCHLSIAGGFTKAVDRAESLGNTALQIFTHSPSAWRMRALSEDETQAFRQRRDTSGIAFLAVHAMYLINLATPDDDLFLRSIDALIEEIQRAGDIGADVLVTHVGHAMSSDGAGGVARAAHALQQVIRSESFAQAASLKLVLENTAGSGTSVGGTFEELSSILDALDRPDRVAVCLDTCHATAAGYDLRSKDAVNRTLDRFDRTIGLERLSMIHLNDAMHPLGSQRDRHEHIGRGTIGDAGIRALLQHPSIRSHPFLLETPKQMEGEDDADPINLARVRTLRRKRSEP
jgi:deoxyribonuclease-4